MPNVNPRKTRRTQQRLAYVKARRPNALKHVNVNNGVNRHEFRKVKRYTARLKRSEARKQAAPHNSKTNSYNPLAPLTGARYRKEERAAEKTQFGPKQQELAKAISGQDQTTANTGTYYDDYEKALKAATDRITAENAANVKDTEGRVDSAYKQDSAAVGQRDAAQAAQESKLGFTPSTSSEGAQAVMAARSQGNQSAARLRGQSSADTKYLSLRDANAVLAKSEAVGRENTKRENLRSEQKQLAADKGAFRNKYRADSRESERTYALARKEFGLKKEDMLLRNKATKADRSVERQKVAAQKIIAKMYSGADRASARAQIRVAKLQLQKGRISKRQYREIVNTYHGLPKKGQSGGAGGAAAPKPLTTSEEKTVKGAFKHLSTANVRMDQKQAAINQLIGKYGYPPRVAREAWKRWARRAPGSNYNKGNVPG